MMSCFRSLGSCCNNVKSGSSAKTHHLQGRRGFAVVFFGIKFKIKPAEILELAVLVLFLFRTTNKSPTNPPEFKLL